MGKWLGYLWTIAVNLLQTIVVIAIFNRISGRFETITVSLLVLIFLASRELAIYRALNNGYLAQGLDEEFKRIRKLLNNVPDQDEIDAFDESQKTIQKAKVKIFVSAVFVSMNSLIALINLLRVL